MSHTFNCLDDKQRSGGIRFAAAALDRGELIVLPTDTVYGVGANAFKAEAVERLLAAKGRSRQSPPPVLIPNLHTLDALAEGVTKEVRAIAEAFWPGALTIILPAQPSLAWDLGDTNGTVALRIPDNELVLELLERTGPLAVSSANKTGEPAAVTVGEAEESLGDSIAVYLDGGPTPGSTPSTIIDATAHVEKGEAIIVLRAGAISLRQLEKVAPSAFSKAK